MLILTRPFPVDLLLRSEAVLLRSVFMPLGLSGVEHLQTFWSQSLFIFLRVYMLFQSFAHTVKKFMSSDG